MAVTPQIASLFPWFNLNKVTWDVAKCQASSGCNDEGGIDISLPAQTQITALCDGTVQGVGTYWGGGVVTVRCDVPGLGPADVYYQHIQISQALKACTYGNCFGQKVTRGQLLGWSQVNPGVVEVGINPPWYGIWGPDPHPGPWITDPRTYLSELAGNPGPVSQSNIPIGSGVSSASQLSSTFQQFFVDTGQKIMLILVALVLIGVGFYLTFSKQINSMVKAVV